MPTTPVLSICVPSRNRQFYFQKTIEGLLRNTRSDVEFVFADNSDDPLIMNDFMAELVKDPRLVYLPSTDAVLPMIGNWERSIRAASGQWVTFIGDDDFIDLDLADLIKRLLIVEPELDALSWTPLLYDWPQPNVPVKSINLDLEHAVMKVPQSDLMKRMFGWVEPRMVPTSGFSIYHGAVRRNLLETIRTTFGGHYFENPNVDYDMAMKVILKGKNFALCARPFSIAGVCPLSNSYSIGRLEDTRKKIQIFVDELGGNFENDPLLRDFPFNSFLGVTASIAVSQYGFKKKYGIRYDGWEKGFAEACAFNTASYLDKGAFEVIKSGYEAAFRKWQGGRFLKHFRPVPRYNENKPDGVLTGFHSSGICIRADVAGASTPTDIWDVISGMVSPVAEIPIPEAGLPLPSQIKKIALDK